MLGRIAWGCKASSGPGDEGNVEFGIRVQIVYHMAIQIIVVIRNNCGKEGSEEEGMMGLGQGNNHGGIRLRGEAGACNKSGGGSGTAENSVCALHWKRRLESLESWTERSI